MKEEAREPQRHTGFLLRRAQQFHVAAWQKEVAGDITNVQYGVLAVLARRPGAAQKELCEELDLDRSTVAEVCVRMERNELISRVPDESDRRRNVLHLTELGRAELDRVTPLVEAVQIQLARGLTPEEHAKLRELLSKLLQD